jgi:hypothetical protein
MKKIYESPLAVEIKLESEQMLAMSIEIKDPETKVDTEGEWGQLSNRDRGSWGNLWTK